MSKDKTNQKGITLIALVITIIVMLILVGVSVTVALNGGLFTTAKEAAEGTAAERDNELALSDGKVTINGQEYNSIDEYVNGGGSNNPTEPENPTNPSEPGKVTITPKKETYTIGEEVTIGEESFYVMADDTEKVTLLAKDCIDTTNLVQSANANGLAFSSTNYWSNIHKLNLNEYPIPEGVTTPAITAAKAYGEKLGGIGRLMTYEEFDTLNGTEGYADILSGRNGKSSKSYLYYWLASTYKGIDDHNDDGDLVFLVEGDGAIGTSTVPTTGYNYDSNCTVRPVIEISKSNIA